MIFETTPIKDLYRDYSVCMAEAYYKLHSQVEKDLEYLINSPSTINRIIRYYYLEFTPNGYKLMFGDKVIRKYEIVIKFFGGLLE